MLHVIKCIEYVRPIVNMHSLHKARFSFSLHNACLIDSCRCDFENSEWILDEILHGFDIVFWIYV
jgi:hypothetical protein